MKLIITTILLLSSSMVMYSKDSPNYALVYYWQDGDPWGWIADSSTSAYEIIKNNPKCLVFSDSVSISKLIPIDAEAKRTADDRTSCFLSRMSDSRVVVLLVYRESVDLVALPVQAHFPIRFNLEFCFMDEEYYGKVASVIALKDRRYRHWYKKHFFKNAFHFYGRAKD